MKIPNLLRWAFAVLISVVAFGCGGSETESSSSSLSLEFPERASAILSGTGAHRFEADDAGFRLRAMEADGPRPDLELVLPHDGSKPAVFTTPGGVSVRVTEVGLAAHGRREGAAVAYTGSSRTSFWTATETSFEEWLLVANPRSGIVAEWNVEGGTLADVGASVEVRDAQGNIALIVTAPAAFSSDGSPVRLALHSSGSVLRLEMSLTGTPASVLVDPQWKTTLNMGTGRRGHTTTLLATGKILVAGGYDAAPGYLATCELYDPVTHQWTFTGSMALARRDHTATLLHDGRVLVTGGSIGSAPTAITKTVEIYDPVAGTWSSPPNMNVVKTGHTATLVSSGKVLVTGGFNVVNGVVIPLYTTEIYDPATNAWTWLNGMGTARAYHTATLLRDGRVLVVAGKSTSDYVATAETWDPVSQTWSTASTNLVKRRDHTATLLRDNRVLVTGGWNDSGIQTSSKIYDPVANSWSSTGPLNVGREKHTATLLPNGLVLVTGGTDNAGNVFYSAELYNPTSGSWSSVNNMGNPRSQHTATLLPTGRVLVVSGYNGLSSPPHVELFDPALSTQKFFKGNCTPLSFHTSTPLTNGKVLVAGGLNAALAPQTAAYLYDPVPQTCTPTGSMPSARYGHTATLLASGKVLVAGGRSTATSLQPGAALYDPVAGTWSSAGSMLVPRYLHTASLLPDGNVLFVGGHDLVAYVDKSERFVATTQTWESRAPLATARSQHSATLLRDGRLLVAGGKNASTLASAEQYNHIGDFWAAAPSMATPRHSHSATLLPRGAVLVAGGISAGVATSSAELYEQSLGLWATSTGSLLTAREGHTATLLPNGKVLIAGGRNGAALTSSELYTPRGSANAEFEAANEPLTFPRADHTATLLPSGRVLIIGGSVSPGSTDLFDEGRGNQTNWGPTITVGPSPAAPGATIPISGVGFETSTEGSDGGSSNSASNVPVVTMQRVDSEKVDYPQSVMLYGSTFVTIVLPSTMTKGWHQLRVNRNGIASESKPFLIQ